MGVLPKVERELINLLHSLIGVESNLLRVCNIISRFVSSIELRDLKDRFVSAYNTGMNTQLNFVNNVTAFSVLYG